MRAKAPQIPADGPRCLRMQKFTGQEIDSSPRSYGAWQQPYLSAEARGECPDKEPRFNTVKLRSSGATY